MNSTTSAIARFARRSIFVGAVTMSSTAVFAAVTISDGELEMLPDYCKDAQTIRYGDQYFNKSPRADHWVSLMGKAFWAIHHYCWALTNLRRANALPRNSLARKGLLDEAWSDYFYVIRNSQPGFVMLPEIWLRIGEVEMLRGNVAMAQEAFQTSRTIKPDYWPAYTRWIDVLEQFKKTAEAKALAAEGLRFAPTAPELVKRYRKFGGDPSTIVAVAPVASAPVASAPAASAPAGTAPEPVASASGAASAPESGTTTR